MRYIRYEVGKEQSYGILEGDVVHELEGSIFESPRRTGNTVPFTSVRLLAPVEPSKILAIGLNYAAHAAEGGKEPPAEPLMFMKAPSSIIAHGETIVLPSEDRRTDHECELVAVIGKRCRNVSRKDALNYVFGYTCGNDVSDRVFQRNDGQWSRAKSFDTFTPLGPWIETEVSPGNLDIKTLVNGEVKQHSNTNDMIFDVAFIIEYLSAGMTLFPGDVIMTGTPAGVSPLKTGDVVEIVIEGIGTLKNPVVYKG